MILYAWTDKLFKIKYVVVSVPVNTDTLIYQIKETKINLSHVHCY